jgi:hypothetical protein
MGCVKGVPKIWGEEEMEDLALGGIREHPSSLDGENDK